METFFRRALRNVGRTLTGFARQVSDPDYRARMKSEQATFRDCESVHELPPIFHYWSHRYLGPKLEGVGISNPDDLFASYLCETARCSSGALFASIGSGNCDTEVRVAKLLRERGLEDFTIECLDVNEAMLARGRRLAEDEGMGDRIVTTKGDFNHWKPSDSYTAIIANQSLHHVVELERLFDTVVKSLRPGGLFVASDIIGRNGHSRWPEAQAIVQEYWQELPKSYRVNRQLHRYEETYLEWDCSKEGFEGIRAQDILPLLVERFEFDLFVAFANVIDPFIDRAFGHNFNGSAQWDRDFIDRVHARDELEIRSGRIKPTHLMAVMCADRKGKGITVDGLQPAACIRWP
jgi:SAM-dependent methyltransferase